MEEWKKIDGYPGYEVSNLGRVRSYHKNHAGRHSADELTKEPRIMAQSPDSSGYPKIMLMSMYGRQCKKVHRLVAEAFIPNGDPTKDTVDHISSDKNDNRVENLQWVSRSENIKKAYADGLNDERIKSQNKAIILTDLRNGEELYFQSINDAAAYVGRDRSCISRVASCQADKVSHYSAEYAGEEEILLYGYDDVPY